MGNNIILKYLKSNAGEEETELFFNWLNENEANRKEFTELKEISALTAREKNTDGTSWTDLQSRVQKPPKKRFNSTFIKRAAIVVFLLGLGALVQYFITGENDVQVYLEGKAFFDVQEDAQHAFLAKSDFLGVRVYGTSFNIQAYPEDEDRAFTTTLIEGSIGLLDTKGEELTRLEPGEKAYFSDTQTRVQIQKVITGIFTSLKEGLVTFRNEKLQDIANQIERWYNVEIIIQKEGRGKERYFGTILKNKPIDQILEVLKLTSSLEYENVPRANKPTLIYWK